MESLTFDTKIHCIRYHRWSLMISYNLNKRLNYLLDLKLCKPREKERERDNISGR